MMVTCALPDGQDGIALRLADFVQCQAQALGENGYQALAGSTLVAALMTALLTILVALIGYRFVLGGIPTTRDAVGWAVRIGMVIALATGWPAFQSVIYRVAIEGPAEIAAILLPAAGLPATSLPPQRIQRAYDAIRLGSTLAAQATSDPTRQMVPSSASMASSPTPIGMAGHPQLASAFVVATLGVVAALRFATGFLLAIGPLAIMTLLFDATIGLFTGWVRALGGAALGLLAATIITALHVLFIEGELARLETIGIDTTVYDPQALATAVIAFSLATLVALWAAVRTAGGFRLARDGGDIRTVDRHHRDPGDRNGVRGPAIPVRGSGATPPVVPDRAYGIASALAQAARRDQRTTAISVTSGSPRPNDGPRHVHADHVGATTGRTMPDRRSIGRRTRSAMQRDRAG